jgi:hypothetical protein
MHIAAMFCFKIYGGIAEHVWAIITEIQCSMR